MTAPAGETAENVETQEVLDEGTKELSVDDLKKELEKVRKEAASHRVKARENAEAKTELEKIRQSQMSDLEKAQARVKELEEKDSARAIDAAIEIAKAKYGFEEDDVEFLHGSNAEEIAASAEKLSKRLGKKEDPNGQASAGQNPNLFPGTRGKPVGSTGPDHNAILRQQLGH